jgi:CheY-like chemotaxis protein
MYIDDDPMQRVLYGTALQARFKKEDISIVVESGALWGMERLMKDPHIYHGIVSDYQMPGVNGLDFLQDLSTLSPFDQAFRALVSDAAYMNLEHLAREAGAVFIPKQPRNPLGFANAIYERFSQHGQPVGSGFKATRI